MESQIKVRWVGLGTCCDIISGATPKREKPAYWGGDIAWATPKDISNLEGNILTDTPEHITDAGYRACSATIMPKGSILFSSRAPIGLVAIAGRDMCTNQGFKSLVPKKGLNNRYLFWCMKRFAPHVAAMGRGATFKEVNKEVMERVEIPIPDDEKEQRRIADILDQADALRRKQQKADLLADDLIHALFLDLFGNPVQNPKGWNTGTLRDLIEDIEAGWSAKGEDRPLEPKEMGVLRVSAVTSGVYKPEEAKAVSDLQGRSVIVPKKGDLLFSRANTKELVAATCLIHEEDLHVFLPDKLWRLIPRKGRATTAFLKYLISFPRFRWTIASKATGTSGSMLNISQDKVLETPCVIPPHDLMQRFHRAVVEIAEVRIRQQKAIEFGHGAFDSLSQQFFG